MHLQFQIRVICELTTLIFLFNIQRYCENNMCLISLVFTIKLISFFTTKFVMTQNDSE